ncbi:MAG: hypothetical protein Pars93KO_24100 [Parasphingorhabdus sp.]
MGCGAWAIVTTVGLQAVTVLVTVRRVRLTLRADWPRFRTRARTFFFLSTFLI